MKLSEIYRKAAENYANNLGGGYGCCAAIYLARHGIRARGKYNFDPDGSGLVFHDDDPEQAFFRWLFAPSASAALVGVYWWESPYSDSASEFKKDKQARVLALLLAAEIAEGAGI
jgi:hypothetical protein